MTALQSTSMMMSAETANKVSEPAKVDPATPSLLLAWRHGRRASGARVKIHLIAYDADYVE